MQPQAPAEVMSEQRAGGRVGETLRTQATVGAKAPRQKRGIL